MRSGRFFGSEIYGFTNWLIKDENLKKLSDVIGIHLTNPKKEVKIGNYFCDVICDDTYNDSKVIIELQYGKTDHEHLGKLLTYASVSDCKKLVWICTEADDEHIKAARWITTNSNNICIYLVKTKRIIVNKKNLIMFECVERPLSFGLVQKKIEYDEVLYKNRNEREEFWIYLNNYFQERNIFSIRKLDKNEMMNIDVGSDYMHITITVSIFTKKIGINLFVEYKDKHSPITLKLAKQKENEMSEYLGLQIYIKEFVKSNTFIVGFWVDDCDIKLKDDFEMFCEKITNFIKKYIEMLQIFNILN